jgi:UDP-N-acetylglucosamine--dolichyl-phosphate N-acetylglucosaminephosphotransferase
MTASTMLISALIMRQGDTALMMAALLGALLAFLRFNWHPARIFLSDVGTLSIGAVMAVAAITGRIKLPFLMVMAPHVIDFFMKASTSFRGRSVYGDTEINADGGLDPPPYPSLPHVFMRRTRLNEPRLVRRLLLFESLFCAITLLYVVARAMDFGLL